MKIDYQLLLKELKKTRYVGGYNLNKLLKLVGIIFLIITIPLIICKLNSIYLIAWGCSACPLTAPFIEKWIYGLVVLSIITLEIVIWTVILFAFTGATISLIKSLKELGKWLKS